MSDWRSEEAGHWMGDVSGDNWAPFGLHLDLWEVTADLNTISEKLTPALRRYIEKDEEADEEKITWTEREALATVTLLIETATQLLDRAASLHVSMFPT